MSPDSDPLLFPGMISLWCRSNEVMDFRRLDREKSYVEHTALLSSGLLSYNSSLVFGIPISTD